MCLDEVYGPAISTENVYESSARKIIDSALKGINGKHLFLLQPGFDNMPFSLLSGTIFAYGQTSSGKTFTMSGITKKAIEEIFTRKADVRSLHCLALIASADSIRFSIAEEGTRVEDGCQLCRDLQRRNSRFAESQVNQPEDPRRHGCLYSAFFHFVYF
jgi:hypothetical protein